MLESLEQRVCVPSREEQREAVCCRGGFGFQGLWFWGESGDPVPCRKLYVLLSVLLCLLVSGLVVFFLFPHSVLVDDDGIKVVQVWFDKKNSVVILAITVTFSCLCVPNGINSVPSCREGRCRSRFPLLSIQATLRIKNSNFYSVTVTSLTSQVQYMNTVVGTQQISSVSSIQPLSDKLVFTFPYNHHQTRSETWALLPLP